MGKTNKTPGLGDVSPMYGYIYLTTNLINGKKYVGQKTSNKFLGEEYLGSGKMLYKAIEKYGRQNFKVELLEEVRGTKSDLNAREIFWIEKLAAVESEEFYNLHPGGVGGATYGHQGHNLTEEQKQHQRNIHLKFYEQNPDKKEALRRRNQLKFSSPEAREAVRLQMLQQQQNPEYRKRQQESHKGQPSPRKGTHHSEETKRLISEKGRGRPGPNKGIKLSQERRDLHHQMMCGRHHWNNGSTEKFTRDCPGEGWVKGTLRKGPKKDPVTGRFLSKNQKN